MSVPYESASQVGSAPAQAPTTQPWVTNDTSRMRLKRAAEQHFQFIWRCIRRFGIRNESAVDDAVQRVFEIAVRRADTIEPGHERAFLFKTAVLVTRDYQHHYVRSREVLDSDRVAEQADNQRNPEQLLEALRSRKTLDNLLDSMSIEQRTVFVLYEIEGLQLDEIAATLEIAQGTVASRLRKARSIFQDKAKRFQALQAKGQVTL